MIYLYGISSRLKTSNDLFFHSGRVNVWGNSDSCHDNFDALLLLRLGGKKVTHDLIPHFRVTLAF
jgi:hypothetical protein